MRQLTESERDAIDAVLDDFEAERVQSVMECLDWRWSFGGWSNEIPDAGGIRRHVRRRLIEAIVNGEEWSKSAGVVIENRNGALRASFEVTASGTDTTQV